MMKKITILLLFIMFGIFQINAQNHRLDVYSMLECKMVDNKLNCDEKDVDYWINVNSTLKWFFIFDKNPDKSLTKLVEMDITNTYQLSEYVWSYDLLSDNDNNYVLLVDLKADVIMLMPILRLKDEIKLESVFFKFQNPTQI